MVVVPRGVLLLVQTVCTCCLGEGLFLETWRHGGQTKYSSLPLQEHNIKNIYVSSKLSLSFQTWVVHPLDVVAADDDPLMQLDPSGASGLSESSSQS